MRDVILAQLAGARAVLVLTQEEGASPSMVAAGLASLDAAAALVSAWGNLDDSPPLPPDDGGVCRHERRTSTATHGNPHAWLCLDCGHNGNDKAPTAQTGG
jgi:hypothetical protein